MEIMVIVFILIVVLNLAGSLLKRAVEGQSRSAPVRRPVVRPRPPRYHYFDDKAPEPAGEGIPMEGTSTERRDEGVPDRSEGEDIRRTKPPLVAKSAATVETDRVAAGLHQLFTQKDQLVSAFIFHEVIGPPRSRR